LNRIQGLFTNTINIVAVAYT